MKTNFLANRAAGFWRSGISKAGISGICTLLSLSMAFYARAATDLKVSKNGHFVQKADGTPFFWLGTTEWVLNSHSDSQVTTLLDKRAAQGFTVIQVFASRSPGDWWNNGRSEDNLGRSPFVNGDLFQFNSEYWNRWLWIAEKCAERNLMLQLHYGEPGALTGAVNQEGLYRFGKMIGDLFKRRANIIFVVSVDCNPNGGAGVDGWPVIAEGTADGINGIDSYDQSADYSTSFICYHPNGRNNSSDWYHTSEWLDINGIQWWHDNTKIYGAVSKDYSKTPAKPTIMLEGAYEDEPWDYFKSWYIRKEAYHSYFAGAAGYAYGHYYNWAQIASIDYVDSTGAKHMAVLASFFKAREWWKFIPDQGMIAAGVGSGASQKAAVKSSTGSECYVYFPVNEPAGIALDRITSSSKVHATWMDPRNGATKAIATYAPSETVTFTPPSGWEDAMLMLNAEPSSK
ncbi:MAG: glycoside hydrolase family 140 protein [Akkermansiaceae bacterium]|nr:glycoside hydrolase family 140 protein [Akkermansiaceae bacterium]